MDEHSITTAFISQYQAALAMFRNAIAAVPSARWNAAEDANPTWRVAYHVLYFTHLYLSGSEQSFEPWELAMIEAESIGEPFVVPEGAPVTDGVYSLAEILAYADAIEAMLATMVASKPYSGPAGFSWLKISRYEHHIRNIRHLQHHTGQLSERARASGGSGLEWTGSGAAAVFVEAA